jgi:RimJ/RimL family protein N-acetyltransferase
MALHGTVARLKKEGEPGQLPPAPSPSVFELAHLVLYESTPGPGGSVYCRLAEAKTYEKYVPQDTVRLEFRTWDEAGEFNAARLWGDPDVTRFIGGPFDLEYVRRRLVIEMDSLQDRRIQYWPIYLRNSETFVGCCGMRYSEGDDPWLGFHLLPQFWRQGFAVEASKSVLEFNDRELGIERIAAGHHPENAASRKVLETLGFVFERMQHYDPTGLMHYVYYR